MDAPLSLPNPCTVPWADLSTCPPSTLYPQMLPACSLPLFPALGAPWTLLLLVKPQWSKDNHLPITGILQHVRYNLERCS